MELFKTQFCDIIKHQICTSTAELNFDELTTEGTYEIYEDAGNGKTRVYLLTVDISMYKRAYIAAKWNTDVIHRKEYGRTGKQSAAAVDQKAEVVHRATHLH